MRWIAVLIGGLRLDSREAAIRGGKSGPALVPGDPDESILLQAARHAEGRPKMPPAGRLSLEGKQLAPAPLASKRTLIRPRIAGLLRDLESRGMLDDTLVVWTSEFGRTPFLEKADGLGREHHAPAFTSWMAGGGVKAGITCGESDEVGDKVSRDLVHFHDFHATILHLLGIDHTRLTYRHAGRDFRLTDVHGNVVKGILA